MDNLILFGDKRLAEDYITSHTQKHAFLEYEVFYYREDIGIAVSREIKRVLSFKSQGRRLFILLGEMTIESQNALLKSLEESSENAAFILFSENQDKILPTVLSRCRPVHLTRENVTDMEIVGHIKKLASNNNNLWEDLEKVSVYIEEEGLAILIPQLRYLMLEDISKSPKYYSYLKKLFPLVVLSERNNVSKRVILDSLFVT